MRLEIDLGNTFAKWRVVERGLILQRGRNTLDKLELPDISSEQPIDEVWIGSVACAEANAQLSDKIFNTYGVRAEFAVVTESAGGVTCLYQEPARMGVDRWLALLAAHNRTKTPVVIVDAGSAVTVDLLSSEGVHVGGYILPGFSMQQSALLGQTAKVRFAQVETATPFGGNDTASSVAAGAGLVFDGLAMAIKQLRDEFDADAQILLAGGDAWRLRERLVEESQVVTIDEIVMDGLQFASRGSL
jgi:type III pantothenate kinase